MTALDGWRGIAVAAVVLFHAKLIPGGWLGVDLFFVLSGFLITRLLVVEHRSSGTVSMRGFWGRRAKRLLPALVLFFFGVAAYVAWYPDPISLPTNLTAEMGAAVAYVANWFQASQSTGYWDTYSVASPLKHMWSLAIEEQFYILFPLVAFALMRVWKDSKVRIFAFFCAAAVLSWSWALLKLGQSGDAFERVYLGTDTRVAAIFAGAAAGYATVTPGLSERVSRVASRVMLPASAGVLFGLVVLDGTTGFTAARWLWVVLFELAVCAVLVSAATPTTSTARRVNTWVSAAPLVWLGTVSYGLYLWHFPALLAAERALNTSPRWLVLTVAIGASVALAVASLKLIETPIRHGKFSPRTWAMLGAAGAAVVVLSMVWVWHSTAPAREYMESREGSDEPTSQIVEASGEEAGAPVRPTATTTPAPATTEAAATDTPEIVEPVSLPQLPLPTPEGRAPRVLLLGDSMAYDLDPGLTAVGADRNVTVSTAHMVGCSTGGMDLVPGSSGLGSADQVRRCAAFNASWPDLAARAAPDVALVVRTSSRLSSPDTGGDGDQCSTGYKEWYAESLRSDARALEPHVGVVAFTQAVYSRYGGLTFPESDRVTDCLNEVTAQVADELDYVVLLPVNDWACPGGECRTDHDGVTLRPDGLHFQNSGAQVASHWTLDTLWGPNLGR